MGKTSVFSLTLGWEINHPYLYDLCLNQKSLVYEVAEDEWIIIFKVRLQGTLRNQWYELA
jgi:hypothetical protein